MEWDAPFTAFVRAHSQALYRSAWLLVGERNGAADLVQDTLTHLYPQWDKVLRARVPIAYVRRAMVNRYLSQARRMSAGETVLADVPDRGSIDLGFDQVLDHALVAAPLAALTPRQRAAITLRYYDDLTDREAARVMSCPVVTLRSHLRRGLAALRARLGDEAAGGDLPRETLGSTR